MFYQLLTENSVKWEMISASIVIFRLRTFKSCAELFLTLLFVFVCLNAARVSCHFFKLLSNEVCSNYISPVGLFYALFRLTDFSSDAFDFSSSKTGYTGSAQRALSALRAFQLCLSSTVLETYTYGVKGGS